MNGDDLQLQGDLACQNAEIRGQLRAGGVLVVPLAIEDEGVPVPSIPHTALNFIGAGVVASDAGGGVVDINIPGGGSGIDVEDEGVPLVGNPHLFLNFVGGGVLATDAGAGRADIAVPGITLFDEGAPVPGAPHFNFNFTGPGVEVTDLTGGDANIAIPGTTYRDDGVFVPGGPHYEVDFIGDGVTASDLGGTLQVFIRPTSMMCWSNATLLAVADTRYLTPGNGATALLTDVFRVPVPFATSAIVGMVKLSKFFVDHNSAAGNGNSVTYQVLADGFATGIILSLATGAIGQASDLLNSFTCPQGTRISIEAIKALNIGGGSINVTASLEVSQV